MKTTKIIRLFLAIIILAFLFTRVGFSEVVIQLENLDPVYAILFLMISFPLIWTSCKKWKLFIPKGPSTPSTLRLMRYYTISYFANLFLPSTLGGDAARSYKLGRHLNSQADSFVATFLERLTGLLAMVLIALFVVILYPGLLSEFTIPIILISVIVITMSVIFLSSYGERVLRIFLNLLSRTFIKETKVYSIFEKLVSSQLLIEKTHKLFWKSLCWSFLFHGFTVINTYLAALSIGWQDVILTELFIVVPLVLLVSMIPLTPGGIGIQESAFVFLLTKIGATSAEGLSIAILLRLKTLLLGVLGGIFFLRKD